MSKIPEQIAYDAANVAYQSSWRGNEVLRRRVKTMAAELRYNAAAAGDYVGAVAQLDDAEAETRALLDERDALYHKLVAARGY
jgi:hypothetical protein